MARHFILLQQQQATLEMPTLLQQQLFPLLQSVEVL
jgi:hypothetical protein